MLADIMQWLRWAYSWFPALELSHPTVSFRRRARFAGFGGGGGAGTGLSDHAFHDYVIT